MEKGEEKIAEKRQAFFFVRDGGLSSACSSFFACRSLPFSGHFFPFKTHFVSENLISAFDWLDQKRVGA